MSLRVTKKQLSFLNYLEGHKKQKLSKQTLLYYITLKYYRINFYSNLCIFCFLIRKIGRMNRMDCIANRQTKCSCINKDPKSHKIYVIYIIQKIHNVVI